MGEWAERWRDKRVDKWIYLVRGQNTDGLQADKICLMFHSQITNSLGVPGKDFS